MEEEEFSGRAERVKDLGLMDLPGEPKGLDEAVLSKSSLVLLVIVDSGMEVV